MRFHQDRPEAFSIALVVTLQICCPAELPPCRAALGCAANSGRWLKRRFFRLFPAMRRILGKCGGELLGRLCRRFHRTTEENSSGIDGMTVEGCVVVPILLQDGSA